MHFFVYFSNFQHKHQIYEHDKCIYAAKEKKVTPKMFIKYKVANLNNLDIKYV